MINGDKITEVIRLTNACTLFLMHEGYYMINGTHGSFLLPEDAIKQADTLFEYEKTEALQALQKLQL